MKSDDNHRNKTTKNAIYKINTELTEVVNKKKHPPLDVKTDAPHLGRITNLVRIQHISWYFETQQERQDSFCKTMANIAEHYFNTDKGVHGSCEELCPKYCCVVKARRRNAILLVLKKMRSVAQWSELLSINVWKTAAQKKEVCQDIGSIIFQFAFFVERPLIKTQREELANLECRSCDNEVDLPKFYGPPQDPLAVKPKQTGENGWERDVRDRLRHKS